MKPSKNEIADRGWNPITGCRYKCPYCTARKITANFSGDTRLNLASPQCEHTDDGLCILENKFISASGTVLAYPFRFIPTYHRYRLSYPKETKNGYNILVGEMGEMFGKWIPDEWLKEIFDACLEGRQNHYLFLTKNPERYIQLAEAGVLPAGDDYWYGVTVTGPDDPMIELPERNLWLNIEPLRASLGDTPNLHGAAWVVIGGDTMNWSGQIQPRKKWVASIIREADRLGIPVFLKESIREIIGDANMRKEIPAPLTKKYVSAKVRKLRESECMNCKGHGKKGEMITICARSKRGEYPKQFGFLCMDCFREQCVRWGIDVPELERWKTDGSK